MPKKQSVENPFKSMDRNQRALMRMQMPTIWTALEALWKDGYMQRDEKMPENLPVVLGVMGVANEAAKILEALPDGADMANMICFLASGAFMARYLLARDTAADPIQWAVAEDEDGG